MKVYIIVEGETGEGLTPKSVHSTAQKAVEALSPRLRGWSRVINETMFERWEKDCDVIAILEMEVDGQDFRVGDHVEVTEGPKPKYREQPFLATVVEVYAQPRGDEGPELLVKPVTALPADKHTFFALRRCDKVQKVEQV